MPRIRIEVQNPQLMAKSSALCHLSHAIWPDQGSLFLNLHSASGHNYSNWTDVFCGLSVLSLLRSAQSLNILNRCRMQVSLSTRTNPTFPSISIKFVILDLNEPFTERSQGLKCALRQVELVPRAGIAHILNLNAVSSRG